MKVKSLRIAVVAGKCVGIGDEFELSEKVAKTYIEKGFVEEIVIVTTQQLSEPKEIDVTMNLVSEQKSDEQTEQKSDEQAEQKSDEQAEQKSDEQAEQKSDEQAGKVKKGK